MSIYEKLKSFIEQDMSMQHIYQPIMLIELLKGEGSALEEDIAKIFLDRDPTQIKYYVNKVRAMVGKVLANNGRIQLTQPWLSKQGFTSSSVYKARDELISRGLISQTKYGGLQMGPNWYAVTWLTISNFVGLDIDRFDRGAWALCKLGKTVTRKPPKQKREEHYALRSIDATNIIAIDKLLVTNIVAKNDQTQINQATTIVNNVVNTNTLIKFRRIVGKKGRSGKIKYIPFTNKLKAVAMYG